MLSWGRAYAMAWLLGMAGGYVASAGCGDDGGCPGTLCTNCAGDCLGVSLSCGSGQTEACVGMSFFTGEASDQRCVFCEDD